MNRILGLTGFLLAAGGVALAITFYFELHSVNVELAYAREASDSLRVELAQQQQLVATLQEESDRLRAELESKPAGVDGASLLKSLLGGLDDASGTKGKSPGEELLNMFGGEDSPLAALGKMLDSEDGGEAGEAMLKEMMESVGTEMAGSFLEPMLEMQLDTQYAALFDELNLTPEVEASIREIYSRHLREASKSAMGLFTGETDMASLADMANDTNEQVRAELAEFLTPEQLTQVDAYETELPRRMARQSYEMQMNMMAPGLAPEVRELAAAILAEENVPLESGYVPNMANFAEEQSEGFDRALARLANELDEREFARVERFLEQQQRMNEWSANLFGGSNEEASGF